MLLPVGVTDYVLMERLMDNPKILDLSRYSVYFDLVYVSVVSYIRRRDRVPSTWDILIVDPGRSAEVGHYLHGEGLQPAVHVVGANELLWTHCTPAELENAVMMKTFTQASSTW